MGATRIAPWPYYTIPKQSHRNITTFLPHHSFPLKGTLADNFHQAGRNNGIICLRDVGDEDDGRSKVDRE